MAAQLPQEDVGAHEKFKMAGTGCDVMVELTLSLLIIE